MEYIYISEDFITSIQSSVKEKGLSYSELSEVVGLPRSTVYRVCSGKTRKVKLDYVRKLEAFLDVKILDGLSDKEDLIKRIRALEEENKTLKKLLIEKWQK